MATSNGLDVVPPELRRRFRLGAWFYDLPTDEERMTIWSLNIGRYALKDVADTKPDDHDYTGADIRNVCEVAWRLGCSLQEASTFVVPVARLDPEGIERLRKQAHGRFLSASAPGFYKGPGTLTAGPTGRSISL